MQECKEELQLSSHIEKSMANGGGAATSYLPQGGREPLCTGQTAHAGQSVSDLPRIREKMPGEERSGKARRVKIVLCRTSVALFRSCGCLGSLPTSATWAITRLTLRGIGILMKLREEGPSVSGAVPSGLAVPFAFALFPSSSSSSSRPLLVHLSGHDRWFPSLLDRSDQP